MERFDYSLRQALAKEPEGVIPCPLFPPVACWRGRKMELPMRCSDCGNFSTRTSNTLRQTHLPIRYFGCRSGGLSGICPVSLEGMAFACSRRSRLQGRTAIGGENQTRLSRPVVVGMADAAPSAGAHIGVTGISRPQQSQGNRFTLPRKGLRDLRQHCRGSFAFTSNTWQPGCLGQNTGAVQTRLRSETTSSSAPPPQNGRGAFS